MLLNLVPKIKCYTKLSCSGRNHTILPLILVAEKVLLLSVISLTVYVALVRSLILLLQPLSNIQCTYPSYCGEPLSPDVSTLCLAKHLSLAYHNGRHVAEKNGIGLCNIYISHFLRNWPSSYFTHVSDGVFENVWYSRTVVASLVYTNWKWKVFLHRMPVMYMFRLWLQIKFTSFSVDTLWLT